MARQMAWMKRRNGIRSGFYQHALACRPACKVCVRTLARGGGAGKSKEGEKTRAEPRRKQTLANAFN